MILDELAEFCDATALNTGGAASYLIGDVIDLGSDFNEMDHVDLVIQVDTTATSGGSATGQFHLCSDAQAAIAVDGTATYHWSSKAFAVASLTAGTTLARIPLPKGGPYERYLGIVQTTGTAAFTAGKVNAFLVRSATTQKAFPNATGE